MGFNIDNLSIILNYSLNDETTHFEEEYDVELPEDVDKAIYMIEELEATDHILYNLLLLQKDIFVAKGITE